MAVAAAEAAMAALLAEEEQEAAKNAAVREPDGTKMKGPSGATDSVRPVDLSCI